MKLSPKKRHIGFTVIGILIVSMLFSQVSAKSKHQPQKIRVGTYQSRAIAVAFAASKYNTRVKELLAEKAKAETAKDNKRLAELKKEGSMHQRKLHRQGFGNAPVDDLLVCVKDKLPKVMEQENIMLIAPNVICKVPDIEVVDITDKIVSLYDPSEKTLKSIKELLKNPPIENLE